MDIFQTFIFQNLTNEELEEMKNLHFLRNASFEKNTLIFQTGDRIHEIGMVLKGSVHIESICGETGAFFPMFRKGMPLQRPMLSAMNP